MPTKDGVLVGVEGTFYFDVNFSDEKVMRAFDDKYGTRTYPTPGGSASYAWDGDDGWSAFLSFTLGNLVQNVLRQEIGNVECADLVASCSLAANSSAQAAAINPKANGNETINQVQQAVNDGFTSDIETVLGVPILIHPRFVLSKVDLPGERAGRDQQGAGRVRRGHRVAGGAAAGADRREGQRGPPERLQLLPDLRADRHPEVAARAA